MFSTLVYPLLLCPISTAFAKPLQTLNDQPLQPDLGDLHLPSLLSSMPYSSNTTWSSLNTSVSNALSIKCDGEEYGFNPDVRDCTNALMRQLVGREQVRFGQRDSVSSEKFLPLPYRLMGGMWLPQRPSSIFTITRQANRDAGRQSALLLATSPAEWSRIQQCNFQSNSRRSL